MAKELTDAEYEDLKMTQILYQGSLRRRAESSRSGGSILWLFVGMIAFAVLLGIGALVLPDLQARYASTPPLIATQPPAPPVRQPAPAAAPRPQSAPVVIRTQGDAPPPVIQPPAVQPAPVADPGAVQVAPAVPPAAAPIVIVQHENSGGSVTITGSGACAVHAGVARRCGDK